ncbi:MAG: rRNA pseudouridine synthase [Deltaproteobacteria bacterium]|jgi:23S rRNA pseudouridine2605 synthase|nr:rRNA pseudouridine synthase [Deltaproteobacteria bacterium]
MRGEGPIRLQKILADAGVASRRAAERIILSGRVRVNGETVASLGAKAEPGKDVILLDGRPLSGPEPLAYYMFHKPEGFITALSDPRGRPTINSFLKKIPRRVYPVGRLDKDVSGFLLLTNDGELARRLMHPSFEAPKVYRALLKGRPSGEALKKLEDGSLVISGKRAAGARARMLESGPDRGCLELVLTEGRRHQVKLMCAQIGHPVEKLKRVAYSGLWLDRKLRPGDSRALAPGEVKVLKDMVLLP